jgi:uncharacterized phage-associated protein
VTQPIATVNQIADFLLVESRDRGDVLTNLKLQKLLYYSQAWHLALTGKPIFSEDFEAWVHGPVVPSQYHRFKNHEWRPIMDEVGKPDLPADLVSHLVEIVDVFGSETATALELMTHEEKPWINARGNIPIDQSCNTVIKKDVMLNYYRSMLEDAAS